MKQDELLLYATCSLCNRKIGATGLPLFWRVSIERFGIDLRAVQRQAGLEAMLGGNAHIARVMGSNDDMASPMMDKIMISVCEKCAIEIGEPVAMMAERDGVKAST